jgi:hypothetical protein
MKILLKSNSLNRVAFLSCKEIASILLTAYYSIRTYSKLLVIRYLSDNLIGICK